MREQDNYSPATSTDYIHWVATDKLGLSDKQYREYNFLFNDLAKIEFIPVHPMDKNRANDGLTLREKFTYETGDFLDSSSGLTPKCSIFEMLAGLAIRIENQLMRNLSIGDRTSKWFLEMIDNLGFSECKNKNWKYDFDTLIKNTCDGINSKSDSKLFPSKKNLVNEEIWIQCMTYIKNHYFEDGEKLDLYTDS